MRARVIERENEMIKYLLSSMTGENRTGTRDECFHTSENSREKVRYDENNNTNLSLLLLLLLLNYLT